VGDADVISTFWFGTSCQILVHDLGRDKPNTMKELLYIATRHASGDEAVRVVFVLGNGKMVLGSSRAHHQKPPACAPRAAERDKSDTLSGLLSLLAAMTMIRMRNVSDEEYVMVVECDFKCQAWPPKVYFEKLLESACPNHTYYIKHKLKDCTMMKNFLTFGALSKGKNPEGDPGEKGVARFPREEAVMMIYD
jgi:hypothetical protein